MINLNWGIKKDQTPKMEDEIKNITSNIEVFDNKIYLYEEIDQNTMFKLNKFIREMNYKLIATNPSKYMPGSKNDDHIELYIHSYGGSVLSAFAAYDLISRNPIPVWTYVEGGAASAATLLSVAGAKRLITKTSYMLIHQLSSIHWGKFEELKDDMKNSENLMNRIKQIYRDKTKIPEKELEEILKHDLWLDAEKCLEWGLADEVV